MKTTYNNELKEEKNYDLDEVLTESKQFMSLNKKFTS